MFKLRAYRRKSRAERIAASNGDAKVEEPYVDEIQSPAETVTTTEDEPSQAAETKADTKPSSSDWMQFLSTQIHKHTNGHKKKNISFLFLYYFELFFLSSSFLLSPLFCNL